MTQSTRASARHATQTVTYTYDAFNRWIGETITAGATTTQTRFVYDGNQIVMQFDGTGTAGPRGRRTSATATFGVRRWTN